MRWRRRAGKLPTSYSVEKIPMPLWSALYSFSYMADTVHLSWFGRLLRPNFINNKYLPAGVETSLMCASSQVRECCLALNSAPVRTFSAFYENCYSWAVALHGGKFIITPTDWTCSSAHLSSCVCA